MTLHKIACGLSTALIGMMLYSSPASTQSSAPNPKDLPWAFPVSPPGAAHPADEMVRHAPGSTATYTRAQIEDLFGPPDWFPNDHPPMPEVVAHGKKPAVQACARCHLANGFGHPQSANLAGLPTGYIAQQMYDFRSGARKGSAIMTTFGKAMTDAEIKAASDYFASVPPKPWTRVVEAAMVPKSHVGGGNLRVLDEGGGTEPIGQRIIQVPEDEDQVENRNPRSGFVAYVPVGSIKRGEAVASGAGGKTVQCTICHGPGLKGLAVVPSIAGRAPTGTVRQLIGFQSGDRNGEWAGLMKGVVAKLTLDDMIALAAYTSSLQP